MGKKKGKKDELSTGLVKSYMAGNGAEKNSIICSLPRGNKVVKELKEKILYEAKKRNPQIGKQKIFVQSTFDEAMEHFEPQVFLDRFWNIRPYYISGHDYEQVRNANKVIIPIEGYDYDSPLYKFKNDFKISHGASRNCTTHFKPVEHNDIQFYTTQDRQNNMLFTKTVSATYMPISDKIVGLARKKLSNPEDKKKLIYDDDVYDRTISISMYVLLEGDANQAQTYFRYDNTPNTHKNIFAENDKREPVYGFEASSPHFHFQNEHDNLLCMRTYSSSDRSSLRFTTSKSNAIDCEHLIAYLSHLDSDSFGKRDYYSMNQNQFDDSYDYEMPFLAMKFENRIVGSSLDKLIKRYQDNEPTKAEIAQRLIDGFHKNSPQYVDTKNPKTFTKLIKELAFLQYINDKRRYGSNNVQTLEVINDLDVLCASTIVDDMSRNSREFVKDKSIKIDGAFLEKDLKNEDDTSKQKQEDEKKESEDNMIDKNNKWRDEDEHE